MQNETAGSVPVWTLSTQDVHLPTLANETSLSPERLTELRTVLASLAEAPIATLEVHPMPKDVDKSRGIPLDSVSPLALHLSQLIGKTPARSVSSSGETLYRMVVPAKVAAQFGTGVVKPMASRAAAGGVHGGLLGPNGIAAQATFVPVAAGKAAAVGGAAGTAGAAAASAGVITVAAPILLMAVAVGVSAYAESRRQAAIDRITDLLETAHQDRIDTERSDLDGCRIAVDKATSILLDQGRVGASLGLDSAVHTIDRAIATASRRLDRWQQALKDLPAGPVEITAVRKSFPGFESDSGEFRAHLDLAELAIALKRRVIVLQAVEHAQMDSDNPFDSFVRALQSDQKSIDELDRAIADVLMQLSTLRIGRPRGRKDLVFRGSDVDKLLRAAEQLRDLGDRVRTNDRRSDVAIEIARESDGSIVVFPAVAV